MFPELIGLALGVVEGYNQPTLMTKYTLTATKRTLLGRKVKRLAKEGLVPASVFGKSVDSLSIQLSLKEFNSLYRQAGETNIIYLNVDSEPKERPVLVKNVQYHPVTGNVLHVDLHQVNLKEKVTANVPVEIIGENQLVKDGTAALNQSLSEIEIEALPTDIPESITFDISKLSEIGAHFTVADAKVAEGVEIKSDPEQMVVSLAEPQKEEVIETPAEEVAPEGESKPEEGESKPATESASESKSE